MNPEARISSSTTAGRKPFADGFAKIAGAGTFGQDASSPKLSNDGPKFVYHLSSMIATNGAQSNDDSSQRVNPIFLMLYSHDS